ncbi:CUB and zona pellucida-like domain-containing protein 1 [Tiliqua scincoides]|uniref:CUB and zona pellucida-like domain-containing protein 1 n=1 Tax=Tiliqua scincoides TaxID=71010 RepID=UPI003461BC44
MSYFNTVSNSGDQRTINPTFDFTCLMNSRTREELTHNVKESECSQKTQLQNGRFKIQFQFFDSSSFLHSVDNLPTFTSLDEDVEIRVTVHSYNQNKMLFLHTCLASPNPNDFRNNVKTILQGGRTKINQTSVNFLKIEDTNCGKILTNAYQALPITVNANQNCTWQIERTVNQTIRLIFSYFQFNPTSTCDQENIEVYDGPSSNAPLLGRICNTHDSVPVFHSSSNTLTFRLSTDSTDFTREVFAFYYFIVPESANPQNCGGYLTGPNGSFTSPNYPSFHPEFLYCIWHIQTGANSKINLTFSEIFLELDDKCRFDFLAIYDGATTDSGLIQQVCGRTAPTFQSSSNMMTVVLSTDYANSYRGFSARYTSVPIPVPEPNTSLSCSSDTMSVILSKSYLDALGYDENDLALNDPTCKPVSFNPVTFTFPLNSCGTLKKTGEDHRIIYSNTITASPAGDVITRLKHVEINVKCIMENNSTVEVMYVTENDFAENKSALGTFNLSMSFYDSDSFSNPVFESPYYVDLNQTLYAQVTLYSSDFNLSVFVDTCTASPNPDAESPKYDLVRNGCPKDDTYVAYPVRERFGRFRFSSFRFLRHLPTVYLHCEVFICDSRESSSRCTEGCQSRHKRDISSYKWKGDTIVGPLRLKGDHSSVERSDSSIQVHPEESQNMQIKGLYTITFVVLVANALLLIGLAAKHFIRRQSEYRYQKL